ncbi:hypothetical protein GCM10010528_15080 [Gordonia defluvii]|uniref:VWFA domain-containing protein n=1 Tax=Gordonia defluvii TaxID=283718 RepID=A0ABP6LAL4_9ACTN|nr:VWA domain-containing protein [Gordonia sp. UBA5067]
MKVNALLDVNIVAHESSDEVAILLELEAPAIAVDAERPPAALQVVLDRSGSMNGAPLDGAKEALIALVRRLRPSDNVGLVTFDDSAQVVLPAGPLTDPDAAIAAIDAVESGGMTDLSAGYLRGIREIRRVARAGGTMLVISDGHVNEGIRKVDEFGAVAAKAYSDGIVTSTLGYGVGYDETLLSALSKSGSGNHVFAADPDQAGAAITQEVDGLLSKAVQAISLTVRLDPSVEVLKLYNDVPAQQVGDTTIMIELGDLYAEEQRKILLKLGVPALSGLGLATIATLEVAYVELPGLVEQVVTLPISVNVVPGDEAAGRVPNPTVHSEVLFQEAQDVKRRASEAFERGDFDEGQALLGDAATRLSESMGAAPDDDGIVAGIRADLAEVERMNELSIVCGIEAGSEVSKLSRDSHHRMNRQRGRGPRAPQR